MKNFCLAIIFLTRIPLPQRWLPAEGTLSAAVPYFPLVGLLTGLLTLAFALLVREELSPLSAAVLIITFLTCLTGGLHLDGLADTADGFLSCKPREDVLRIMKDPSCGTMGVLALLFLLALKVSLVAELLNAKEFGLLPGLLLAITAGRVVQVLTMCLIPAVRSVGLGASAWNRNPVNAATALATYAMLTLLLTMTSRGFDSGAAVLVISLPLAATLSWSRICTDKIGGGTGDTLGAISEITEVLVLAVVVLAGVR